MNEPPDLTDADLRVRDYIRTLLDEIVRLNDRLAEAWAVERVRTRHTTNHEGDE